MDGGRTECTVTRWEEVAAKKEQAGCQAGRGFGRAGCQAVRQTGWHGWGRDFGGGEVRYFADCDGEDLEGYSGVPGMA